MGPGAFSLGLGRAPVPTTLTIQRRLEARRLPEVVRRVDGPVRIPRSPPSANSPRSESRQLLRRQAWPGSDGQTVDQVAGGVSDETTPPGRRSEDVGFVQPLCLRGVLLARRGSEPRRTPATLEGLEDR